MRKYVGQLSTGTVAVRCLIKGAKTQRSYLEVAFGVQMWKTPFGSKASLFSAFFLLGSQVAIGLGHRWE